LCVLLTSVAFCGDEEEEPGPNGDPNDELNGSISGDYEVDGTNVDDSIGVSGSEGGYAEASPGGTLNVSISFDAPNANVVGGGIRFGANGPVQVVTIPDAMGQTSGTLNFAVQIPDSVCSNLSQICHDIRCYEFAVTDIGAVSQANINDVALMCGGCDEPSCQSLLDMCEVPLSPYCQDAVDSAFEDFSTGDACMDACVTDSYVPCIKANDCQDITGCVDALQSCFTGCTG